MTTKNRIYKDFNDWWSHGKHGCSSASRDWAEMIWADFEPTIAASRDDYTALMLLEIKEMHERYVEHLVNVSSYVRENNLEAVVGINLYRWILNRRLGRVERPRPQHYRLDGRDYAIVGQVLMKDLETGELVPGYQYILCDEPSIDYVSKKSEFDAKFEKVPQPQEPAVASPASDAPAAVTPASRARKTRRTELRKRESAAAKKSKTGKKARGHRA